MNGNEPNHCGNACVLRIHVPEPDVEKPTAIEIKVIRKDWPGNKHLPAPWSWPRRGQEARRKVALAPRQLHLIEA